MQATWVLCSNSLPRLGEPVQFLVDGHSQPINGTYVDGSFHSRFATYATDQIESWCHSWDCGPIKPYQPDVPRLPELAAVNQFAHWLAGDEKLA